MNLLNALEKAYEYANEDLGVVVSVEDTDILVLLVYNWHQRSTSTHNGKIGRQERSY